MSWLQNFFEWLRSTMGITFIPKIGLIDALDILFVTFLIYEIILWFRSTRTWTLFKGLLIILAMALLSSVLKMNMTSWFLSNTMVYGVLAIVIIFQPEIRKALEKIGHGRFLSFFSNEDNAGQIPPETVEEIITAMEAMAQVKTGALICVEQEVGLGDYEQTGISLDALVTSQLLINIFEKNTPLHDGAIVIRHNRVTAATCYLPLSDDMNISKEMGTRHRAALGLSEVSDAIILVVSEETGGMSIARDGKITRNVTREDIIKAFEVKEKTDIRASSLLKKLSGDLKTRTVKHVGDKDPRVPDLKESFWVDDPDPKEEYAQADPFTQEDHEMTEEEVLAALKKVPTGGNEDD